MLRFWLHVDIPSKRVEKRGEPKLPFTEATEAISAYIEFKHIEKSCPAGFFDQELLSRIV
jgi:hypothetical protein